MKMAAFVAWKPCYTVNDPALDAEHKQIIETISSLHSAMNGANAAEVTKRALDQLVRYTYTHFEHEERVLKQIAFPDFEAHKQLHDNMRRRSMALRGNLNIVTARDVLVLLRDWWLEHIQGEDKKYAACLEALAAN